MVITDTQVGNLIINDLTGLSQAQADSVVKNPNELYLTNDGGNVMLLNINGDIPITPDNGDKYYNPNENLIYTYDGTIWDNGIAPYVNTSYINITDNIIYYYDGTSLISTGGGSLPESDFAIYGNQSSSTIASSGKYMFLGSVDTLNISATTAVEIVVLGTINTLTLPTTTKTVLLHANGYTGETLTSENTGALADGSRIGHYNIRCIDII